MGEQRRRKESGGAQPVREELLHARKLWIIAVLAFWISAAITLVAWLITGKLDLILLCITLGMMVLGVWLKARYQLGLRRDRAPRSDTDGN